MGFSRWALADLQVHTPADKNHRYGNVGGPEPNLAFATSLVRAHADAGVSIMAVTDHNRVDWWPLLAEAGEANGVAVFPGLEINVNKCHLLIIWDRTNEGYQLAQRYLNSRFKAGDPKFLDTGHPIPVESGSPLDNARNAAELHGLVFAPHSTAKNIGLFGTNVCNTSSQVAQSGLLAGFDVVGSTSADVLKNPRTEFGDRTPVWFISGDVRALDEVGKRAVYLKVSDCPTLESIRQAFLMPFTRIRFPGPQRETWGHTKNIVFLDDPAPSWPFISNVKIAGGFHDGLDVSFGPGLNAVIGGKGTGKSTMVEILRYVCQAPESTAPAAIVKEGLSNREANFAANAEATIEYQAEDGESYEVKRVGGSAAARLSRGGALLQVEVPRRIRLRVFGQRELAELHTNPQALREFVASQTRDAGQAAETRIRSARDNCHDLDQNITGLETQLGRLENDREELSDLEERLLRLSEQGAENLVAESQQLGEANRSVAALLSWPSDLKTVSEATDTMAMPPELIAHELIPTTLGETRTSAAARLTADAKHWAESVESIEAELTAASTDWSETYRVAREDLDHRLADTGLRNTEELASIQRRVAELRTQLAGTPEQEAQLEALLRQRGEAMDELSSARRELSRLVEAAARVLNERSGSRVRVVVDPLADQSDFAEFLSKKVMKRKLSEEQISKLRSNTPATVIAAITEGKSTLMALGLSAGLADRLIELDHADKRALEEVDMPDHVSVQVDLDETGDPRWTEIKDVSPGQAATAMLSLALVGGDEPLVIDQPEDDLDNRFVYEEVVQLLARVSSERQVIVATHNANIPVLGDAELITAFDASAGRAFTLCSGGLDEPGVADTARRILEGGDDAFKARARRYESRVG
jgi:DNA repair ATPase RecN